MKKLLHVFFALTLGLLIAGCAKEYDDTELKGQVDKLTQEVNTLKANQQAMQAIIDVWKAGGYIQSIDNSVPGQHTITFYGENGKTVVLYDGAQGPQGEQGPKGENGDSFFKSVTADETGVTFEKVDGTKIFIPFAKAFKLVIENPEAEVEAGKDVEFTYSVQNANATTSVDVFAGGNYAAVVKEADKKIVVTAPTPVVNGSVLAWAQNDEGLFSMKKLNFVVKAETTVTTTAEEYQGIPADAGSFDVAVVSNVDIEVPAPNVDWVTVAVTKANYKITLTLKENTTGAPRETVLKINRADNGKQVQEIKIVQLSTYAAVPTVLWSEDWTGGAVDAKPEEYTQTGTKVIGDLKVTYASTSPGTATKIYKDDQMNGTDVQENLLLSKAKSGEGGTWTITGIPSAGAKTATLTFKVNAKRNVTVTSPTENVTLGEKVIGNEAAKPYSIKYDITIGDGVKKFALVFTNSDSNNIRLDDLQLITYDEVVVPEIEKVPALERVWGFYKDGDTPWYATTNITGVSIANPDGYGMARGLAMDDEYIYLPKSSAYANVAAVSIADKTVQKALNKTGISGGSVFATSFVRMIKNTDSSVNGGKDVLLLCNLTATASDEAQLKLYAYKDGIDAAPTKIAAFCWDSANNVNDWRRYGDRFFVTGNWADGKVYFPSFDANKTVVLSIANGARTAVTQIAAGADNSPAGIKDLTVYPGDNKLFLTNPSIANLVAPTGGKANGWDEYSLSSSIENGKNTWGYNFFEFNGVKYIAYARIIGETKAQIEVIVDKGDLATSLAAQEGLLKSPIHDATDLDKEVATGNLADCCVRVIGDNVYIAALTRDGGFVLDKMVLKEAE